jgi:hypothetical protein
MADSPSSRQAAAAAAAADPGDNGGVAHEHPPGIGQLVIEDVENNNNNNNNANHPVVTQLYTQLLMEAPDQKHYSSPSSTSSSTSSFGEEEDQENEEEQQNNVGQEEEEDKKSEHPTQEPNDAEDEKEVNQELKVAVECDDDKKEEEVVAQAPEDQGEDSNEHNVDGANVQHNKSEEELNKGRTAGEEPIEPNVLEAAFNPEVEEINKAEEHNVPDAVGPHPKRVINKISYIDLNYHSRFRDWEVCRMFVTSHLEGASMSDVEAKRQLVDAVVKRTTEELVLDEALLSEVDPMFHGQLKQGLFKNLKAVLDQCRTKKRNKEKIAPFDRFCNIPTFSEDDILQNLGSTINRYLPCYTMTISFFRYVLHGAHMRGLDVIDIEEFYTLILQRIFINAEFPVEFINLPQRPDSLDIQDDLSIRKTLTPLFYKGLFPMDNIDYDDIKRKYSKCTRYMPLCQKHVVMVALLYIKRGMLEHSHHLRDQQYHRYGDEILNIADRRKDLLEDPTFKADGRNVSSCAMLYITICF